jgi:hypothetical protein
MTGASLVESHTSIAELPYELTDWRHSCLHSGKAVALGAGSLVARFGAGQWRLSSAHSALNAIDPALLSFVMHSDGHVIGWDRAALSSVRHPAIACEDGGVFLIYSTSTSTNFPQCGSGIPSDGVKAALLRGCECKWVFKGAPSFPQVQCFSRNVRPFFQ